MIILLFVMKTLLNCREDVRLYYSGTIQPQHSWAISVSLWIILNSPLHLWLQRPVSTGNRNADRQGEKLWGVRECMRVKDPQTLSSLLCLFFLTFRKYSLDPQCGIISPFIPSLAVFLPLHLLFLPPLPQSCVSLPFPSTSLPPSHFSLSLWRALSLCASLHLLLQHVGRRRKRRMLRSPLSAVVPPLRSAQTASDSNSAPSCLCLKDFKEEVRQEA